MTARRFDTPSLPRVWPSCSTMKRLQQHHPVCPLTAGRFRLFFRMKRNFSNIIPFVLPFLVSALDAGPILPEQKAEKMLDSFESVKPIHKTWTRGKLKWKLTPRTGYSKDGQKSLLVELDATGEKKGRNSLNLLWNFTPPADWSAFDGLMLWYQAQDESSPGFTVSLIEESGANYWKRVSPEPRKAGKWQTILLPLKSFSWSWEGPRDKDKKLDISKIRQIRMEARGSAEKRLVFSLDGFGLYNALPAYEGPVLSMSCTRDGFIRRDSKDYQLVVRVDRLPAGQKATVSLKGVDFQGETRLEKSLTFTGEEGKDKLPNRYIKFKNEGPNYIDVFGTLSVNGKLLYREKKSFAAIVPQSEEDQKANPNSIFGIWVGGGPWSIGAKWTRTYCRGGDVKLVDGKYQFRNNPPGVYQPKANPRVNYTFYFSQMPKWLSSKPERADWQKWSPKSWDDYDRFLQWVITGAKAGGFTHYEVWNEPVPYAYWMGPIESVVKLHEVTYKAIKKVQPDAVVLGPCPYSFVWNFIEKYFELGGAKWIDEVVVHTYGGNPDIDFAANLQKLKSIMRKHGIGDRDIYITEMGYRTPVVTERQQAQFMVRAYMYAWSEGIRLLTWHMLWDYTPKGDPGMAILRHDHTPRPAYAAYATMTRLLERAKFTGPVEGLSATQRGFRFEKRGKLIRVLWDTKAGSNLILNHDQPVEIINLVGGSSTVKPADGMLKVPLSLDPIYVLSEK